MAPSGLYARLCHAFLVSLKFLPHDRNMIIDHRLDVHLAIATKCGAKSATLADVIFIRRAAILKRIPILQPRCVRQHRR